MTVKDLYNWAVKNECENGEIVLKDSENNYYLGQVNADCVDCLDGYTVIYV